MESDRRLLRIDEAADVLALGRSKVYELVAAGEIRSVTIGAARRIPREAIEEYVQRLAQAAAS